MKILFTFLIAGLGVALFLYFGLPLPWLLGPMFACLCAALVCLPMQGIKQVNDGMRTILGVAVGATFTPILLLSIMGYWSTLLLIPVMLALIAAFGVPYFYYLWRFDFATSYYSTMPGGLQDMLVFGEEAGANVRTLSLIHATRVLIIVVSLPFILESNWGVDLSNPPGVSVSNIPLSQIAVMVICGLIGWRLFKRLGLFGASIIGPIIIAGAAAMVGILQHRPPVEAIWLAQFFIGMTVGIKYTGITLAEIRRDVSAGLGYCLVLVGLTFAFTYVIEVWQLAPPMEALLAFAPGGQAELTVLALIVGAEMSFVVTHHVVRMLLVIMGAPLLAKWIANDQPK